MIVDLKKWLRGTWQINREIRDLEHQVVGHFEGLLTFTDDEFNNLAAHEEGETTFGAHHGLATSNLIYHFPSLSVAKVLFHDRRYFHDLDLRLGFWKVGHHCGSDRYVGRFTVQSERRLDIDWSIKGPNKKLEIKTVLMRILDKSC